MEKTKLIAFLGTPLSQSISYQMQNRAYEELNVSFHYLLMETDADEMGTQISHIRKDEQFVGFAITKPGKEEAISFVDELDPLAENIGSINTVVRLKNGKWRGYNTDGYGALCSLREEGIDPQGKIFFLWGAGGTGKSVAFALAQGGAKTIYLCSRSEQCCSLAKDLNQKFGRDLAKPIRQREEQEVIRAVAQSEVLMNLTGLGMRGHEKETVIDAQYIRTDQVCFDATYNPMQTRFLREATEKGCKTINGLGMLVHQGARQVEIWTGKQAPLTVMRETAVLAMRERLLADKGEKGE